MSEVMTVPPPVVERKCKLEEVFEANFLELLRLVPRNPQVRGLLLKLTGKLPPPEAATFEQLKDWVETQCERPVKSSVTPEGVRRRDGGIAITVEFSETEYGRADYSVRRYGSEEFRLGAADLMELVNEAIESGGGLDEVVELVAGKIDEDAWEVCDPSMDDYGDYNYDEHDVSDTHDSEAGFSRAVLRNLVLAFVRERHPELAAEL